MQEIGKHKADFSSVSSFDLSDVETFKVSLVQHSIDRDIEKTKIQTLELNELKCEIKTPDKRNPCIVTVWIVEKGQQEPKLVTAYPAK
ncbi:MAG: hypothetical protein IPG85_13565 [Bacteroidetes bacterium]|nr:hypothetical protein [Bacteroidota bacterium]